MKEGLVIFIVFALVFSFILHDILPHEHHDESGGFGLQAFFHSNERKWLFFVVSVFTFILAFKSTKSEQPLTQSFYFKIDGAKIFNVILLALRKGVLNPKLYSLY